MVTSQYTGPCLTQHSAPSSQESCYGCVDWFPCYRCQVALLMLWLLPAAMLALGLMTPASAATSSRFEYQQALDLTPDIGRGRALFIKCVGCHQADGSGLASKHIPGIAGQHYRVLIDQLAQFRASERRETRMSGFSGQHQLDGPQDLADVSMYVASLLPRTATASGSSNRIGAGARIYAEHCSRCHGDHGEGDPVVRFPRLAGQHYGYLLRQLDALRLDERDRRNGDHEQLLAQLSRSRLRGLAAFIASMRPAPAASKAP